MPRALTFQFGNAQFEAPLHKVDRSKLYGSVDVRTKDHEGETCKLATLARDGHTLIPLGGTASGYLNADGFWVETGERIPVDVDGDELHVVDSSFDAPIPLTDTATEEDLLDHPIRLAYHLAGTEPPENLRDALTKGAIYRFGFSYRGGPVEDPAFLIADQDGALWLLIGSEADVDFRTYQQAALCASVAHVDSDEDDDADVFDFDMM